MDLRVGRWNLLMRASRKSWYGSTLSRGVSRRLSSPNSSSESLSSRFWNFCAYCVSVTVKGTYDDNVPLRSRIQDKRYSHPFHRLHLLARLHHSKQYHHRPTHRLRHHHRHHHLLGSHPSGPPHGLQIVSESPYQG